MGVSIAVAAAAAFLLCVILSPLFIPFLRRLKFGQSIREEGPESHHKKSGTPTMGGIMVLISIAGAAIAAAAAFGVLTVQIWMLLLVLLSFGFIGFLDDFIKVAKKRNLGLTSRQKLMAQLGIAAIFFFVLNEAAGLETSIGVPGTSWAVELGWMYLILVMLMLVGASNAVNLTDGLDGLLAGTTAAAFGAYAILSWYAGAMDVAIFSAAVVGAVLGFLVFNAHPAKVFIGDTGSLALGGAIAAVAISVNMELLLVIIGGVFVIETLSVMIQVVSYKTTGKRIFRMSPLHHHYELSGWSEWKVVTVFWLVGLVFAALGIYIEVWM
ncbi:phospho-N-acetylmuramoyl-pentapeptide-transferase [Salsuginibacillus halophilus]|uniref:Phospho-N-acetylmuramoyl-pentapeptide-transferase n=1 Tax=Salsuginibacillus halophilus TaxID=517424 RepID=A0A2P8HX01_9BACI|nr:phospho-N-acetylmuramoyl-pentapeptide-transferase [Salsuginibacillus halophilus]PSL50773.1 phospho-N-acetylmuramoyl-pentapeptide-transferase [Salsuginibacillus halophilus]